MNEVLLPLLAYAQFTWTSKIARRARLSIFLLMVHDVGLNLDKCCFRIECEILYILFCVLEYLAIQCLERCIQANHFLCPNTS